MLAVFSMLHGVEHARRSRVKAPSPFFNLPAVAAFAVGFGAAGYPLVTRSRLPVWATLLISLAAGALAVTGMITLLAKWALKDAPARGTEDAHDIQGIVGVVTREISTAGAGEISYERLHSSHVIPARGLDTRTLTAGTEVVIDRIEEGVAFVESWEAVEKRL